MSQIDVNIIEPIPYIQIMQGVGPKGDKGDKGDTGEVTQAEFDELSDRVGKIRSDLTLAMENIFEIERFKISVDNINYSDHLLVQNGATYGSIYINYRFTLPPLSIERSAFLGWWPNRTVGTIYNECVDISDSESGSYTYGEWDGDSRKSYEPIISSSAEFWVNVKRMGGEFAGGRIAQLVYCDKIHYGAAASGSLIDSFLLSTLTGHELSETRELSFSVNAGANQYVWIALPVSYGAPKFTVGGFDGGFTSQGKFNHTNNLSYRSQYELWRSDNKELGDVNVTIS